MDEIKLDYEELRNVGSLLDRVADNYYDLCMKMRLTLDPIHENAPDHYDTAFEIYKFMLSIYDKLSGLSVGTAEIVDSFEGVEQELMKKSEELSERLLIETSTAGAVVTASSGRFVNADWDTSEITKDDFIPSAMISSEMQHEDWLIGNYAEKYLIKE